MSTAVREVRLTFKAELNDLKKTIKESSDYTDAEIKKMVNKVEYHYKNMEKEAKRAAKAQRLAGDAAKQSGKDAEQAFDGAAKIMKFFGGTSAETASLMEDFSEGLAGMSGVLGKTGTVVAGVGLGLTAASLAGAGFLSMVYELVSTAGDAAARLEEMGNASLIPEDAAYSIQEFAEAQIRMNAALDRLQVIVAGGVADDLADLLDTMTLMIDTGIQYKDSLDGIMEGYQAFQVMLLDATDSMVLTRIAYQLATGAVDEHANALDELNAKYNSKIVSEYNEEQRAQLEALGLLIDEEEEAKERKTQAEKSKREAIDATKKAERERQEKLRDSIALEKEQMKAYEGLVSISEKYRTSALEGADAVNAKYDAELKKIDELSSVANDDQAAKEARWQLEVSRAEELAATERQALLDTNEIRINLYHEEQERLNEAMELQAERIETTIATLANAMGRIDDVTSDWIESNLDKHSKAAEKQRQLLERNEEKRLAFVEELESTEDESRRAELQAEIAAMDSKIAMSRQELQEKTSNATKAFKFQKEYQTGIALIDGALLALQLSAPPPVGLGPIAGPSFAGFMTGAAVAGIAAQKPPKFHTGGIVQTNSDEQLAILRNGESVLNQRGTEALGESVINAINDGIGLSSGQPLHIYVQLDGKTIAKEVTRLSKTTPRGKRA